MFLGLETALSFSRDSEPRNCLALQDVSLLLDLCLSACLNGLFAIEGPRNKSVHGTGRVGLGAGLRPCLPLSIPAVREQVDCYLLFQRNKDLEGPWDLPSWGWV